MGVGLDPLSGQRDVEQTVRRRWLFLAGFITKTLQILTGAADGKLLKSDSSGAGSWGDATYDTLVSGDQTASSTDTLAVPAAGEYMVTVIFQVITAGTGGTAACTVAFTDDVGATTQTLFTGFALNATGRTEARYCARVASGAIDVTYTLTGAAGTPHYSAFAHNVRLR